MIDIKKIIGHILIIIGIMIPLQAFTQISVRDMAASSDYSDYRETYKDKEYRASDEAIESYNSKVVDGSGVVDPFVADDYKSSYGIEGLNIDDIFAYLIIPSIDVKQPIRLDASYDHLDKGVAHVYGTSLPTGGINRRSVIAGHRGWYRGIMLLNLGKMKKGDKVYIDRMGKALEYEVTDIEIISPSQWQRLKPREGKDMLTILSCHPIRPPSPYRMLVNCERVIDTSSVTDSGDKASGGYISSSKIDLDIQKRSTPLRYAFYIVTLVGWIVVLIEVIRVVRLMKKKI